MSEIPRFIQLEPVPNIILGNLVINAGSYSLLVNELPVELSVHEFEVLSILARQPDRILPFTELAASVWHSSDRQQIRNLNVLIHRLRQKLAGSRPFAIQTVRGRGYGLVRTRALATKADSNLEARLMTI